MDLKEVQAPSEYRARVIKIDLVDNMIVPLCPDYFKEFYSDALMVLNQKSCFLD